MGSWFRRNRSMIFIFLGVSAVLALLVFSSGNCNKEPEIVTTEITYSQFIEDLESGKVKSIRFHKKEVKNVEGVYKEPQDGKEHHFSVLLPAVPDYEFIEKIRVEYGVTVEETDKDKRGFFGSIGPFLPLLVIVGFVLLLYLFVIPRMMNPAGQMGKKNGGGNRSFVPGLQRMKMGTDVPKERFSDVAGVDEAVEEMKEVVDFLKAPAKYQRMGAEMPRGVLLVGPPGTGKTLLARAVAGEAGVPFFYQTGSEFVEMFVGVGASRVRDLFDKAKKQAPAIIFIDEIDSIGTQRGAGVGGGHDEQRQTITQILSEMDGFEPNIGLMVIAATNRPDILDPALLRPGRFDIHIIVPRPMLEGRHRILEVHMRNKPYVAKDVELREIARKTFGFSGADLKNLTSQAARSAVRNHHEEITMQDFREARNRVLMGLTRKDKPSDKDKKITAFHEAGHALVSYLSDDVPLLEQVSILPRGGSGGFTEAVPDEENLIVQKQFLLGQIQFAFGGRIAEEIIFGEPSTGAHDDLGKATEIAENMVIRWGMSDKFVPRTFARDRGPLFLGRDLHSVKNYSDQKQAEIDEEIERILREEYEAAKKLLRENEDKLRKLAEKLLEKEEMERKEIEQLLA